MHDLEIVDASPLEISYFAEMVPAGFPSPALDHAEGRIDLNRELIKHPAATFIVRASGDSLKGVGIFDGDLLVVDRSIQAHLGCIVVAVIDADMTVKILGREDGRTVLCAANPAYPTIRIPDESELQIWGVVTRSIRHLLPPSSGMKRR